VEPAGEVPLHRAKFSLDARRDSFALNGFPGVLCEPASVHQFALEAKLPQRGPFSDLSGLSLTADDISAVGAFGPGGVEDACVVTADLHRKLTNPAVFARFTFERCPTEFEQEAALSER